MKEGRKKLTECKKIARTNTRNHVLPLEKCIIDTASEGRGVLLSAVSTSIAGGQFEKENEKN